MPSSDTQPHNAGTEALALAPCSAIPAIESAALNIGTAARDADNALECWDAEKWADSVMWINNAIAQLESARAKIEAHTSSPNAELTDANKNVKP